MSDRSNTSHCGTESSYKFGCRCRHCTEAHRRYVAEQKAARLRRAAADPTIIPHGTSSGYVNWACRCADCAAAYSDTRAVTEPVLRRWTDAEIQRVMGTEPIEVLVEELQRSKAAIVTKRYMLRKAQQRQGRAAAPKPRSGTRRAVGS